MEQLRVRRGWSWRTSQGFIAAAAVVVGGLSPLAFASPPAAAATRPTSASVISTVKTAKFGSILEAGEVVYTLKPSKIACTADCLKVRPPVLLPHGVKGAKAGPGVDASMLGTIAAVHGARQITYSGKALYWSVKDTSPGQVKGNTKDKWGRWSTVVAASAGSGSSTTAAPETTLAPATTAPETPPAQTSPPQTAPPQTEPPETAPPATSPPVTHPTTPPTTSPSNGGVGF